MCYNNYLKMGLLFISFMLILRICVASNQYQDLSDNEFAEFEDFEGEEEIATKDFITKPTVKENTQAIIDDPDITIDDDLEFEHFQDVEEFEGFEVKEDKPAAEPKITIAKIPLNFRQNWDSYYLEILMVVGLIVYFINFATGRNKNNRIANTWFQAHRQILEDNFSLVGDDGALDRNENISLIKESENIFTLWCSGRTCCEGMLVELKLIKRQDLLAILSGVIRSIADQIHITVRMNKEDMDNFVFCIASKKTAQYLSKEMADISVFCPERKSGEKYNIKMDFNVMSELPEATAAMLDSKMLTMLNTFWEYIDYIHFSDQFSGPKQNDDGAALKLPDAEKVLLFGFNIVTKGTLEETMLKLIPLMNMVFYCMDKVKRFRLSKEEFMAFCIKSSTVTDIDDNDQTMTRMSIFPSQYPGKTRAEKNRQRVEEAFLKSTHQARAEAAAAKREERRRQEKEKVMAEEDPDRQRRWELKEEKRQAKKRAPKMKQLKVKAL